MITFVLLAAQVAIATPPRSQCIGHPVAECIAAAKAIYTFDDDQVANDIAALDRVDVNGAPLARRRSLNLFVKMSGRYSDDLFGISLNKANVVTGVQVQIDGNPELARSQDEYDQTKLYDALSAVLPTSCWNDDRVALYRFFENSMKPKIVKGRRTIEASGISYFDKSTPVTLCGYHLTFISLLSESVDDVTLDNPHGVSRITTIDIDP